MHLTGPPSLGPSRFFRHFPSPFLAPIISARTRSVAASYGVRVRSVRSESVLPVRKVRAGRMLFPSASGRYISTLASSRHSTSSYDQAQRAHVVVALVVAPEKSHAGVLLPPRLEWLSVSWRTNNQEPVIRTKLRPPTSGSGYIAGLCLAAYATVTPQARLSQGIR